MTLEHIEPQGWPRGRGYAHGIAATGTLVLVAGQIGWDPITLRLEPGGFAAQVGRALENVAEVLAAAGARPEHVVRMTWFVTDREAYLDARPAIGASWRAVFGAHFPAMSVVFVAALLEPGALVEIEATAVRPA